MTTDNELNCFICGARLTCYCGMDLASHSPALGHEPQPVACRYCEFRPEAQTEYEEGPGHD